MPKSTTLAISRPPGVRVTRMLSGFRSRCTMPSSCAPPRPSTICLARSRARVERERCFASEDSRERLSVHEFHHQIDQSVALSVIEHGGNVRMNYARGVRASRANLAADSASLTSAGSSP